MNNYQTSLCTYPLEKNVFFHYNLRKKNQRKNISHQAQGVVGYIRHLTVQLGQNYIAYNLKKDLPFEYLIRPSKSGKESFLERMLLRFKIGHTNVCTIALYPLYLNEFVFFLFSYSKILKYLISKLRLVSYNKKANGQSFLRI